MLLFGDYRSQSLDSDGKTLSHFAEVHLRATGSMWEQVITLG